MGLKGTEGRRKKICPVLMSFLIAHGAVESEASNNSLKERYMRKVSAIALALILSAIGFAQGGYDSTSEGAFQEEAQTRDMFIAYGNDYPKKTRNRRGRPGARVRIELQRNGVRQFVPLSAIFRAGDRVKFHFAVNFPAHVSVINRGSSGRLSMLFPYKGAPEVVGITKNYSVPHRDDLWFEFDSTPGTERLTFVFSSARLLPPGGKTSQKREADVEDPPGSDADMQSVLDELDSQSIANSRDLNLVQVSSEESYVLCDEQQINKPLGFHINLRHK